MRLEVTRRADLAVRAVVALADAGRRLKAAELAEALGTTSGFVPQVIGPLVERRWVRSDPGPTGGYLLAVPAESLSVLHVIEAIEGATDTDRCVLEDRLCSAEGPCALHLAWARARAQLLEALADTPLSALQSAAHR